MLGIAFVGEGTRPRCLTLTAVSYRHATGVSLRRIHGALPSLRGLAGGWWMYNTPIAGPVCAARTVRSETQFSKMSCFP